jgi:hypothetical protein
MELATRSRLALGLNVFSSIVARIEDNEEAFHA